MTSKERQNRFIPLFKYFLVIFWISVYGATAPSLMLIKIVPKNCSHLIVLYDLKRARDNKAEAVNALPSVVEQVPRGAEQQSLNQISRTAQNWTQIVFDKLQSNQYVNLKFLVIRFRK